MSVFVITDIRMHTWELQMGTLKIASTKQYYMHFCQSAFSLLERLYAFSVILPISDQFERGKTALNVFPFTSCRFEMLSAECVYESRPTE